MIEGLVCSEQMSVLAEKLEDPGTRGVYLEQPTDYDT